MEGVCATATTGGKGRASAWAVCATAWEAASGWVDWCQGGLCYCLGVWAYAGWLCYCLGVGTRGPRRQRQAARARRGEAGLCYRYNSDPRRSPAWRGGKGAEGGLCADGCSGSTRGRWVRWVSWAGQGRIGRAGRGCAGVFRHRGLDCGDWRCGARGWRRRRCLAVGRFRGRRRGRFRRRS